MGLLVPTWRPYNGKLHCQGEGWCGKLSSAKDYFRRVTRVPVRSQWSLAQEVLNFILNRASCVPGTIQV